MNIQDATGTNRWCGPHAVSIIAGIPTDTVAKMIRERFGRRKVTGTHQYELAYVLETFGYKLRAVPKRPEHKGRITIARWLKLYKADRTAGRVFLMSAGHHWQVICGRRFACSMTHGKVVSVRDDLVGRRRRVRIVYEVTKP